MTRLSLLALALLLPTAAFADDRHCAHSAARDLSLDLSGVKTVMFEIGHNDLRVNATPGAAAAIDGKACASAASLLDQLKLTQERKGDRLVVRALREGNRGFTLGTNYAYMTLDARVPDDVMVQFVVGSGDARVDGAHALSIDLGSGDVEARRIRGRVTAKVGSGDIELDDIGELHVLSIGSGDVKATNVRGKVEAGSVGSGELALRQVGGDVKVDSIGSGDFSLKQTRGNVDIGSIGSGDADLEHITGNVGVGSIGSGDLDVEHVTGNLTVRSKGSGDVRHRSVGGTIELPRKR